MDHYIFTASVPTADQSDMAFNTGSSHMFSGLSMQPTISSHDTDTHEPIIATGYCSPTLVQDELLNNLYVPQSHGMFNGRMPDSRTLPHNVSCSAEGFNGNIDIGTSSTAASLTNVLPLDVGCWDNMFSINNSFASTVPLNTGSINGCNSFYSSCPSSRNHDYWLQDGPGHDDFLKAASMVHPSYHIPGIPNNSRFKLDQMDNFLLPRNELSLSLGSCQPPIIGMPDLQDHCSERSCSVVTQVVPKDNEELSLCCGPSNSVHFSHILLGSRYLAVAQRVLAEFVNYALGDSEELDDSVSGIEGEKFKNAAGHLALEETRAKKTKLAALLQMLDDKYNQCLDHIQNAITTFHDATNSSSPRLLARFALLTVASAFKKLRERISKQILLDSQECRNNYMRGKERASESSLVEKQWTLQLGRKDQQSWRPQRGLPERSVSVLRAWMFQNFLHPYPKDNDKQLLALHSGLTRSQVSNWFINARVRLWKPMIEDMYSELRKQQTEDSIEGDIRTHGNISNQRPGTS